LALPAAGAASCWCCQLQGTRLHLPALLLHVGRRLLLLVVLLLACPCLLLCLLPARLLHVLLLGQLGLVILLDDGVLQQVGRHVLLLL
jgi:hypothetical protein